MKVYHVFCLSWMLLFSQTDGHQWCVFVLRVLGDVCSPDVIKPNHSSCLECFIQDVCVGWWWWWWGEGGIWADGLNKRLNTRVSHYCLTPPPHTHHTLIHLNEPTETKRDVRLLVTWSTDLRSVREAISPHRCLARSLSSLKRAVMCRDIDVNRRLTSDPQLLGLPALTGHARWRRSYPSRSEVGSRVRSTSVIPVDSDDIQRERERERGEGERVWMRVCFWAIWFGA